jgi:hypothetical protein
MKKYDCGILTNKASGKATHALRKQAMGYLYDFKKIYEAAGHEWERVTVRIAENGAGENSTTLAAAWLDGNAIWITERALARGNDAIRRTVWHELGHALLGLDHIDGCPLMHPYAASTAPTKGALINTLKRYL